MFVFRIILGITATTLMFGAALLGPAGTWDWWRAWVLLAIFLAASVISTLVLLPRHSDLLRERFKWPIRRDQPRADKIVMSFFMAAFGGAIFLIPLDVFRFHLMERPPAIVSSTGLVIFIVGWLLETEAMRENAFASAAIRHQEERGQKVIDGGLYAVVRHPLYAGAMLVLAGMPLWLESYAATLAAAVPMALLVVRIRVEEKFLTRELEGYAAYTKRVRYGLVPYVW